MVVTIGLDIAKSVFQVHGIDAQGAVVVRQRLQRSRVLPFFAKRGPCLVGDRGLRFGAPLGSRARPAWT